MFCLHGIRAKCKHTYCTLDSFSTAQDRQLLLVQLVLVGGHGVRCVLGVQERAGQFYISNCSGSTNTVCWTCRMCGWGYSVVTMAFLTIGQFRNE